jgi:prepilin-type N-terminal cleavage/methylation domain-containing protein
MARQIVLFNEKGVSLIELMIALVILLVVSLAMMQTALIGMSTNLQNALRDEATNIGEMRINQLRALPFTDTVATPADLLATAPTGTSDPNVERNFRSFTEQYRVKRTVTNLNTETKQIAILVSWDYRNKSYSHGVTTIMRMRKQ